MQTAAQTDIATPPSWCHPTGIAITPDGNLAFTVNNSNRTNYNLSVIDIRARKVLTTDQPITVPALSVAVTHDGTKLLLPDTLNNKLVVIDIATPDGHLQPEAMTMPTGNGPCGVAVTRDGLVLTANGWDNTVTVIDLGSRQVKASIQVPVYPPWDVAVTPDESKALVVGSDGGGDTNVLSVIDLATLKVTASLGGLATGLTGVTISPDGSHAMLVYSGYDEWGGGFVQLVDITNTPKLVNPSLTVFDATGDNAPFPAAAFAPDGSLALCVVGGGPNRILVF
jgi:YVTN family beta-propeller protein